MVNCVDCRYVINLEACVLIKENLACENTQSDKYDELVNRYTTCTVGVYKLLPGLKHVFNEFKNKVMSFVGRY